MDLILKEIKEEELTVLRNLFEFVAYDLSELNQSNIMPSGLFEPKINAHDLYHDKNYYIYLISLDNQLAGFIIVKYITEEEVYYLNHFFILRKFRNQQIGKRSAKLIFDRFKGKWRVSEFDWNLPAQRFWRNVLEDYTNNNYVETRRTDNKGPLQEFTNNN